MIKNELLAVSFYLLAETISVRSEREEAGPSIVNVLRERRTFFARDDRCGRERQNIEKD